MPSPPESKCSRGKVGVVSFLMVVLPPMWCAFIKCKDVLLSLEPGAQQRKMRWSQDPECDADWTPGLQTLSLFHRLGTVPRLHR